MNCVTFKDHRGDDMVPMDGEVTPALWAEWMLYQLLRSEEQTAAEYTTAISIGSYREFCKRRHFCTDDHLSFIYLNNHCIGFAAWQCGKNVMTNDEYIEDPLLGYMPTVDLQYIYIQKSQRDRGYGRKLLQHVLEQIYTLHPDADGVELGVVANNTAAYTLYKSMGFDTITRMRLLRKQIKENEK